MYRRVFVYLPIEDRHKRTYQKIVILTLSSEELRDAEQEQFSDLITTKTKRDENH